LQGGRKKRKTAELDRFLHRGKKIGKRTKGDTKGKEKGENLKKES